MPRALQAILKAAKLKFQCQFCRKGFEEQHRVRQHVQNAPNCRRRWQTYISTLGRTQAANRTAAEANPPSSSDEDPNASATATTPHMHQPASSDLHERDWDMNDAASIIPMSAIDPAALADLQEQGSEQADYAQSTTGDLDVPQSARFVESYPRLVPDTFGEGLTQFEQWKMDGEVAGTSPWAPFESEEEWDLVRWMGENLGHNQIEAFLKLRTIQKCDLSVGSSYTFFKNVDKLPSSQRWMYDEITVVGDRIGEDQKLMTERVELWRRDPLECVRELIGNPDFRNSMSYAPEKIFADMGRNLELPPDATIAPVILASDKTRLMQFRGDQTLAAWPVYLSIGNIAKEMRRKVSARAMVLVGYIPTSKLECFTKGPGRSVAGYRLVHQCMHAILDPLIEAGKNGVLMVCADGKYRKVYPILATYVADHPEQCLVINCKENHCPRGTVSPDKRGEPSNCVMRNLEETIRLLNTHETASKSEYMKPEWQEDLQRFDKLGLRPVYEPFWLDMPHCNIYDCITPDILHQLHKGVFKDHLMAWVSTLAGKEEVDRRFKAMAQMPGLRHFKNGISEVSQWTEAEHKNMQKVIVGLLAGSVSGEVLAGVQALVDFIYLAQFQLHTDVTLRRLQDTLEAFHSHKEIFERLGLRKHFNIPKLHSLVHYLESIRERGPLDGFNTELSERLHIDFAKEAYRAGNCYGTLFLSHFCYLIKDLI
ncbi:hypothetical protein K474DRAFT_1713361 [Panus rudis PR-1116 ss-1]|nr:hypothetical protein K474DRAFT_1713361 [Panus rudis PR-1116 ss-1]